MSLLPKGGADMCGRCDCTDAEICELCGGCSTEWSRREVQLDADHQGELIVKMQEVIQDNIKQTRFNLNLLTRITENKATNADLEYIDCL